MTATRRTSPPPFRTGAPRVAAVTLQAVADAAGVHLSTASRALNPETARLITADVAARVGQAARDLGYQRDLLAAGLRTSRTRLVGVLVPDMANPVFAPILAGVEAVLAERGYAALVGHARGTDEEQLALVQGLVARRVEGLILATARDHDPVLAWCLARGVPTVLVNRADPAGQAPAATSDDRQGMRLAVRHLAGLGHRRILHLAGPQDVSTGRLRAEGYREAMRDAGLPPGLEIPGAAYTRDAGRAAAEALLARQPDLTAIAAANDLLALGAYQALAARGLRCPADVSVTGHNDMPLVDMVEPPLTTVRINHDEIGRGGAALLLERIAGAVRSGAPAAHRLARPELVVRTSTASPGRARARRDGGSIDVAAVATASKGRAS